MWGWEENPIHDSDGDYMHDWDRNPVYDMYNLPPNSDDDILKRSPPSPQNPSQSQLALNDSEDDENPRDDDIRTEYHERSSRKPQIA